MGMLDFTTKPVVLTILPFFRELLYLYYKLLSKHTNSLAVRNPHLLYNIRIHTPKIKYNTKNIKKYGKHLLSSYIYLLLQSFDFILFFGLL